MEPKPSIIKRIFIWLSRDEAPMPPGMVWAIVSLVLLATGISTLTDSIYYLIEGSYVRSFISLIQTIGFGWVIYWIVRVARGDFNRYNNSYDTPTQA